LLFPFIGVAGFKKRKRKKEEEKDMDLILIAIIVVFGAFLGLVVWEILLNKAGATVVIDEKSWLMAKWRELGRKDDPRNLCELFQVVMGVGKVGRGIEKIGDCVGDLYYSAESGFVPAKAGWFFLKIFCYVIAGIAYGSLLILPALAVWMSLHPKIYTPGDFWFVIGMIVFVYLILFFGKWSERRGKSWRAFRSWLGLTWLKACPPVTVRRQQTSFRKPTKEHHLAAFKSRPKMPSGP